jgi:hypothetical protein
MFQQSAVAKDIQYGGYIVFFVDSKGQKESYVLLWVLWVGLSFPGFSSQSDPASFRDTSQSCCSFFIDIRCSSSSFRIFVLIAYLSFCSLSPSSMLDYGHVYWMPVYIPYGC